MKKKDNYKWWALALLWVAFFLQQGTRQLFGPSVPSIMASTGADKVSVGVVGTVFGMMYGLCVPFAGITADIFRRKWMVTIGVGIFCLGIFASGFVSAIGVLIVTYGILNGCGQSFYYPSATSLISQLHKESRATAISILQLGLYVGIVGCGSLAGFCAANGADGWRWPFWVFGGVGLAWVVVLSLFLRDTPPVAAAPAKSAEAPQLGNRIIEQSNNRTIEQSNNRTIEQSNDRTIEQSPSRTILLAFKAVFTKPTALCVVIGLAMMIYVDIGFKNWMPAYLQETFGRECPFLGRWAGLHAVLWHYLGAVVGVLGASRFGDRLVKGRPGIRLELGVIGLAAAIPFIVWMAKADSFAACCVAMGLFGLFRGVYDSNFMASFFDVVNPRYHASGVGIMMCVAFLFGSLSSTVLPWIQNGLGRSSGLASLAGFYLVGALVLVVARVAFLKRDYEK